MSLAMVNEESTEDDVHSPRATQYDPASSKCEAQLAYEMSRGSSQFAHESFFTAEEYTSRMSPETSRSVRRTRSAARLNLHDKNSSLISSASTSAKGIGASSPGPSTPFRAPADLNAKTSATPHLDHVLSFHQKVSPSIFSPDAFTSFALESDTPGSHDSGSSYFGNWRFYSPGLGDAIGDEIPPKSLGDASVCSDDSSDEGHQVVLLPQPYSLPSATNSVPFLSGSDAIPTKGAETGKLYPIPLNRSKSLSALYDTSSGFGHNMPTALSATDSERDYPPAFSVDVSIESMRSACHSPRAQEDNMAESSISTYELVGSLNESAQNGKRTVTGPKLITKPLKTFQEAVHRLFA